MPSMTLDIGGLEVTLIALQNSSTALHEAAPHVVEAAGQALRSRVRKRIGLRDHSLKDLARMDHPYARRHGSIRIHRNLPWQVHRQSGTMAEALEGTFKMGVKPQYEVTFNYLKAPHAEDVIRGTKVMLPRDVLWNTAHEEATNVAMMKRIVKVLGKKMRSKLGIRFGSGVPGGDSFGIR